jgi:hypothetical protein
MPFNAASGAMPGMSGLGLKCAITDQPHVTVATMMTEIGQEPRIGKPWPIIPTTRARQEGRQRCIVEGMSGFIAKPIREYDLLALVTRSTQDPRSIHASPRGIDATVRLCHLSEKESVTPQRLAILHA